MSITFNPEIAYTLEDDRVLLRPLLAADFEYLLPFALNEPDTWNYSLTSAAGEDGMRAYIDAAVKGRAMGKEYPFIVFDKVNGEYAGTTRFYDIQPAYQTLQLGYTWYGEKFRGTGLNKHCKFLLLQFAFDQLGIERVEFRADARNQRSIAAMKGIGCVVEGVLRSHTPLADGSRRDSIMLSILKNEWEYNVRDDLKSRL
jgi:RimJ/RimL family protein N-acetyltransferase